MVVVCEYVVHVQSEGAVRLLHELGEKARDRVSSLSVPAKGPGPETSQTMPSANTSLRAAKSALEKAS